jgi:hypothetical protein
MVPGEARWGIERGWSGRGIDQGHRLLFLKQTQGEKVEVLPFSLTIYIKKWVANLRSKTFHKVETT